MDKIPLCFRWAGMLLFISSTYPRLWWTVCRQADLWPWCLSCLMSRRSVHVTQSRTNWTGWFMMTFSSFCLFVYRCLWCTSWWGDTLVIQSPSSLKRNWCSTVDSGGSVPLLSSLSIPQVVHHVTWSDHYNKSMHKHARLLIYSWQT